MKVQVHPDDAGGCGAYRCIWPAQALAAQGADVELVTDSFAGAALSVTLEDTDDGIHVRDAHRPDADVVVIQRPFRRVVAEAIPHLQAKGVVVVVEVDDDFGSIHRRNVSWEGLHPGNRDRSWKWLARSCALADLVVVTTQALARRYGKHGRCVVVPNLVPERYLTVDVPKDLERTFVGWTGSIETHPTDLQVTGGAVARAIAGGAASFAVVGTGAGVQTALHLDEPPLVTGWVDLDVYAEHMAQLDIGIVPLDDIAFNHAKSCLKGLEFAALGVPFVASPVEDYVRLAMHGAGVLAARPREWQREITRLLVDEQHLADVAGRGRETASRMTIEANCGRWWDAWTSAKARRRAA